MPAVSSSEPPVHLHLLSSFEAGWDGLNLIYELEPADEMPETYLRQHFILIALVTLVEICQEVGFASQSHFTRVFRQHTKTTPKAYRDAL